jgi:LPXTG-motif cell wall-anchored protein
VALDGLDPAGKTATLTIRDKDGKEVAKFTDQPLSGRIIYPGASAEPKDWPGWKFANDKWEFDPTDARVREGVTVTADVNPSATGSVSYPAATEKCNSPEIVTVAGPLPPAPPAAAPPAAAPPAPAAVPGPDVGAALPATGSGSWLMALLATMLVLAGSSFVALGRRTR